MRSLSPSRDSKVCHDVTRVATRTSRIQLARRSQLSRSQMKSNAAGSAVVPGGGTIAPVWYSARARRTDPGPPGPAKTRGTRTRMRISSDDHRGKYGEPHASRSRGSDTTTAGRRPRNAIGSGHVRAWIARGRTMTTMTTMGALRGRSLVTAECCSGKRRTVRICTSGNDERKNAGRMERDRRFLRSVEEVRGQAMSPLREMLGRQRSPSLGAGVRVLVHVNVFVFVRRLKATQNCHGFSALRLAQVVHR